MANPRDVDTFAVIIRPKIALLCLAWLFHTSSPFLLSIHGCSLRLGGASAKLFQNFNPRPFRFHLTLYPRLVSKYRRGYSLTNLILLHLFSQMGVALEDRWFLRHVAAIYRLVYACMCFFCGCLAFCLPLGSASVRTPYPAADLLLLKFLHQELQKSCDHPSLRASGVNLAASSLGETAWRPDRQVFGGCGSSGCLSLVYDYIMRWRTEKKIWMGFAWHWRFLGWGMRGGRLISWFPNSGFTLTQIFFLGSVRMLTCGVFGLGGAAGCRLLSGRIVLFSR